MFRRITVLSTISLESKIPVLVRIVTVIVNVMYPNSKPRISPPVLLIKLSPGIFVMRFTSLTNSESSISNNIKYKRQDTAKVTFCAIAPDMPSIAPFIFSSVLSRNFRPPQ